MAVVSEVTLHKIPAAPSSKRREQLSERRPEKRRTVNEKNIVNTTPESSPYLLSVNPGMSIDIM